MTTPQEIIKAQLQEAANTLETFVSDARAVDSIAQAAVIMHTCLQAGGKIISCGNGGSMCDAMHFAEEMTGRFRDNREAMAAIAISDPSHITCTGNDYGFEKIFSRYVEAVGRPGDVLLAISTSGNSKNVLEAGTTARKLGMKVVALTGNDGGQLAAMCDVEIRSPKSKFADRAQEIHIKVIHCLILCVEKLSKK